MRVPFAVYADFECFTERLNSVRPSKDSQYTMKYKKHEPSGFCFLIVSPYFEFVSPYFECTIMYMKKSEDEDIGQIFFETLKSEIREVCDLIKCEKEMIFTDDDNRKYKESTHCHICGKSEFTEKDWKVRDHCHISGKFIGAAHNTYNMRFRVPKFTPVFFHNLSGYDSHLFVKNLGMTEGDIRCIPNKEEKYISFSKNIKVEKITKKGEEILIDHEIRFLDSLKFMACALRTLVDNFDKDNCKNLRKFYNGEKFELLKRKGVYPYDCVDSLERLSDNKLPSKEEFYSPLNNTKISDEDYQHAKNVWGEFDMKSMREYHDLYLKSDVLLLADVFENFRDVCMSQYGLDPCWYYTSPQSFMGRVTEDYEHPFRKY